jgi:hypothetical protein
LEVMGDLPDAPGRGEMVSGSTVFHSPQVSQRPAHFGVTAPQAWQTKRVVALAKGIPEGGEGGYRTHRGGRESR